MNIKDNLLFFISTFPVFITRSNFEIFEIFIILFYYFILLFLNFCFFKIFKK
jgi:threonine/homoserine/homoserine lactone efflux protein